MKNWEKLALIGYVVFMLGYAAYIFSVSEMQRDGPVVLPLHVVGMLWGILALVLVFRDLFFRKFVNPNAKIWWTLAIVCTGGIGFLIYLWYSLVHPRG